MCRTAKLTDFGDYVTHAYAVGTSRQYWYLLENEIKFVAMTGSFPCIDRWHCGASVNRCCVRLRVDIEIRSSVLRYSRSELDIRV